MGKITGFLEFERCEPQAEPVERRILHFREFLTPPPEESLVDQAARCMDCGVPYCHSGCPVNNQIPDWNDLVFQKDWRRASDDLHSTNNFPEFTGRICPAPCEAACTLNLEDAPVAIKAIECAIVDRAWKEGWIVPLPCPERSGRRVAVIGSGPAGLAAAQQLARGGHDVRVYEKHARPGGLLRYGIPDFKLEKSHIDRRLRQMEEEGVTFVTGVHVGVDVPAAAMLDENDAVLLCGGSESPRDLPLPGRDLDGIHFAMDFLTRQNRANGGETPQTPPIDAKGKHVVVIGGGDTGSDCIGTSFRQGAASVIQLELLPAPPERENKALTWPHWPVKMRTSSSQAEGAQRDFSVMTTRFSGRNGCVDTLHAQRIDDNLKPVADSEFTLKADLVLLAMGFVHPVHRGMIDELRLERDDKGNVKADFTQCQTNRPGVFVAGDMRRGQSLVVHAIREGRNAAEAIDAFLKSHKRPNDRRPKD